MIGFYLFLKAILWFIELILTIAAWMIAVLITGLVALFRYIRKTHNERQRR